MKYLTIAETMSMLSIGRTTVYRLIRDGDIMATRVGRSVRIDERSIRDYLAGNAIVCGDCRRNYVDKI